MRVLGIDPGLSLTGYGCVADGPGSGRGPDIVEAGCFRLNQRACVSERLVELESDLAALVERVGPDLVCVESVFAHSRFPRTSITMAHARGVILLVIARAGCTLIELPPAEVKKSVTGNGRASKAQVQEAIAAHLGLDEAPEPADVADALAAALCGWHRSRSGALV